MRGNCILRTIDSRAEIDRTARLVASVKYWNRTRLRISASGKLPEWLPNRRTC